MSRKTSIRHVVGFLFMAGTAPLWARSPAATCVSQARKNWNFDTQGCKTGGMKTYLSPSSAFYFRIRRGMRREIPGLQKAIYGNPSSFRLRDPIVLQEMELACSDVPIELPVSMPSKSREVNRQDSCSSGSRHNSMSAESRRGAHPGAEPISDNLLLPWHPPT